MTQESGARDPVPAIAAHGLTKAYGRGPSTVRAVDDIEFQVPRAQVLGLLGPNGAGKTTTIKMMCGLVLPTAGTVLLNGYDVVGARRAAVTQLGAVLEGGRNVYWSMSAWQNLLYFGRLKGLRGREIKPRARTLLRELGLWERRSQLVGSFSRGMQQKVAVAAALITDPPILLLDEPTVGLDTQAARTVKDWITRLAHEQQKTVVLTTHQLEMAAELCDRIAIMSSGRVATDMATSQLLARARYDRYRITVEREIDPGEVPAPAGVRLSRDTEPSTLVATTSAPSDLYELVARLRDVGVTLHSITPVTPDIEDIFLEIVAGG